jgi:hypothetical protein
MIYLIPPPLSASFLLLLELSNNHKYSLDLIPLVAISFTKKKKRFPGILHPVLGLRSRQPYSRTHRSVYPMSDLAATWDMDGTTNDDTTSTSTVLDGSIPDSHHRPAQTDSLDFQIFLIVCFLAKEDRHCLRDIRLAVPVVPVPVPVLFPVHNHPEPNMQMLNRE